MDKREITLDKVEEKARKLHGDRYSYIGLIKEEELHRNLKDKGASYIPKKYFGGMNECYTAVYWSTL